MKKMQARLMSILTAVTILIGLLTAAPMQAFAASNEQIIYDYLTGQIGFNTAIACGILANIEKESSFNPQNSYMESDGYISYGICQWHKGRFNNLKTYCSNNGYDYTSLNGQLHFLKYEIKNNTGDTGNIYNRLKAINDSAHNTSDGAYQAGYDWCYYFERPANTDASSKTRGNLAETKYWPKYHPNYDLYIHYNVNGGVIDSGSDYYSANNGDIYEKSTKEFAGNHWVTGSSNNGYGLINASTFKLTRTGYSFKGWCLNKDGSTTIWDQDDATIISNDIYPNITKQDGTVMLYAIWEKNKVAFQYNANGGVIADDSDYYLDNNSLVIYKETNSANLNNWDIDTRSSNGLYNASTMKLSRPGYQFKGWTLKKNSGTVYDQNDATVTAMTFFPDIKTKSGTVLFYAYWEPNVLTVHYHTNGGYVMPESSEYTEKDGFVYSKSNNSIISEDFKYDGNVNFYNCTTLHIYRENYRFVGWSIAPEDSAVIGEDQRINAQDVYTDLVKGNQEINVYAQWEPVAPTVKLYENKSGINYLLGSDLEQYKGEAQKYGTVSTYSVSSDAKHNGENILSVNVLQDDEQMGTRQFSIRSSLAGSVPYTGEKAGTGTYYISFYAKAPAAGAKIGARFGYAALDQTAEMTTDWKYYSLKLDYNTITDANVHFHFSKAGTYELSHLMLTDHPVTEGSFIAESETEPMTVLTQQDDVSFSKLPTPERLGYAFKGWYTQRSGGTMVSEAPAGQSSILYAQWEEKPIEIVANNGDKISIADIADHVANYVSSREKVAIVSKSGVITAVGEGNTIISLVKEDGSTVQIYLTVLSANATSGDITMDGLVNCDDVHALVEWLTKGSSNNIKAWKHGDMNGDGKLNAIDLTLLKREVLKG